MILAIICFVLSAMFDSLSELIMFHRFSSNYDTSFLVKLPNWLLNWKIPIKWLWPLDAYHTYNGAVVWLNGIGFILYVKIALAQGLPLNTWHLWAIFFVIVVLWYQIRNLFFHRVFR